jgi:hypothetical protein
MKALDSNLICLAVQKNILIAFFNTPDHGIFHGIITCPKK